MEGEDTFCDVCEEEHESATTARSHERAAVGYDEKYGVAV